MTSKIVKYGSLLANAVRYDGAAVLAWRVLRQIVSPFGSLEAHVLLECDLTRDIRVPAAPPEITVRTALPEEMASVVAIEFGPDEPAGERRFDVDAAGMAALVATARSRMAVGDICIVAAAGSDIVHFSWLRFGTLPPVLARPVHLPDRECYLTDGYTVRRWRGRRLFDVVSAWALEEAKRRGYVRAYAMADFIKAPSRRMARRVGFFARGRVLVFRRRGRDDGLVLRLTGRADPLFHALW
ncbi:MAG: hypothetical protein JNL66_10475 [Alphaproteobacteria bacterium]|nr:hypothetical protein [Alphaproteobacteria bacterium]